MPMQAPPKFRAQLRNILQLPEWPFANHQTPAPRDAVNAARVSVTSTMGRRRRPLAITCVNTTALRKPCGERIELPLFSRDASPASTMAGSAPDMAAVIRSATCTRNAQSGWPATGTDHHTVPPPQCYRLRDQSSGLDASGVGAVSATTRRRSAIDAGALSVDRPEKAG